MATTSPKSTVPSRATAMVEQVVEQAGDQGRGQTAPSPAPASAKDASCDASIRPSATPPRERFPKLAALIDYLDSLTGRADLKVLTKLLTDLNVTRADIDCVCTFGVRGYRRNTISKSPSGTYELLALCWKSGHCTPIHDHQGVSCAFKIVQGLPTEIRFTKTASGLICPTGTVDMKPGYICAADDADIHQVVNLQGAEGPDAEAITLHIYSPAIKKMNTYEFKTSAGAECGDCY